MPSVIMHMHCMMQNIFNFLFSSSIFKLSRYMFKLQQINNLFLRGSCDNIGHTIWTEITYSDPRTHVLCAFILEEENPQSTGEIDHISCWILTIRECHVNSFEW